MTLLFDEIVVRAKLDMGMPAGAWSDAEIGLWVASGLDDISAHLPRTYILNLTSYSVLCSGDSIDTTSSGGFTQLKVNHVQRNVDNKFLVPMSRLDPLFPKVVGYYDIVYSRGDAVSAQSTLYLSGCDVGYPTGDYRLHSEVNYQYVIGGPKGVEIPPDYIPIVTHFVRWQAFKALLGMELMNPPDRTRTETDVRDKAVVLDQDIVTSDTVTLNTTQTVTPNTTKTVTVTNPSVTTETGNTITAETGTVATATTEATDSTETTDDDVVNTVIAPADADKIRWLRDVIEDARLAYYALIEEAKGTREWQSTGITHVINAPARVY